MASVTTNGRYGMWRVLGADTVAGNARYVLCECECGTQRAVLIYDLARSKSLSCGCARSSKAGLTLRRVHRETYISWVGMKQRATYEGHVGFHRYGGRGIEIDAEWLTSFEAFLRDMGPRPIATSIDRRDNDGPYSKANCYWATKAEQSANTSRNVFVTHEGERYTLKQLAQKLGCNYFSLHGAYRKRGLSLEESIARVTSPARRKRPRLPA